MTLFDTVRAIENLAGIQPAVSMIVRNDVFRLNTYADARYGVFAWTQNSHRARIDEDVHYFSFSLFYVDRLTADKGNELEIQSVGVQALENILRGLAEMGVVPSGDYTFNTFNQRFLDECAGVWCSVSLEVPVDLACPDPDFGPDPVVDYGDPRYFFLSRLRVEEGNLIIY